MTLTHRLLVFIAVAGLLAARPALADPAAGSASRTRLVVVVAAGSPLTNLSASDLKRVFTGVAVTAGGRKLIPFNFLAGTPERVAFDRFALGMSPGEVGRFWVDRKVRGQGQPPRSLPSSTYVAKVVAGLPGALGYLPADQLAPGLKPITIAGLSYTDPAYAMVLDRDPPR